MDTKSAIAFHTAAKTPLWRLANSVRWFEDMALVADKEARGRFRANAKRMRAVVTGVFVERHLAGEYAEAPVSVAA